MLIVVIKEILTHTHLISYYTTTVQYSIPQNETVSIFRKLTLTLKENDHDEEDDDDGLLEILYNDAILLLNN
jgi:hypothetical protein